MRARFCVLVYADFMKCWRAITLGAGWGQHPPSCRARNRHSKVPKPQILFVYRSMLVLRLSIRIVESTRTYLQVKLKIDGKSVGYFKTATVKTSPGHLASTGQFRVKFGGFRASEVVLEDARVRLSCFVLTIFLLQDFSNVHQFVFSKRSAVTAQGSIAGDAHVSCDVGTVTATFHRCSR
jgi:hypothetical protein